MAATSHSFDPADLVHYADRLRPLARRLVTDVALADDVVQDALATALSTPPRPGTPLGTWLATVVRHRAANLARGRDRRETRERATARSEALPPTAELVERLEWTERLAARVRDLPEHYREVVLLRYFEDLKPAAIAERLEIPVNTVRTRLERAHARLAEALDRDAGDRRDWALALVPLASVGPRPAWLASISTALGSGTLAKLASARLAAALALIAVAVGYSLRPAATPAAPAPTGESAVATLAPPATPAQATPARREAVSGVREVPVQVVDLAGGPVAGLLVRAVDGSSAVTDEDGRVVLEAARDAAAAVRIDQDWAPRRLALDQPTEFGGRQVRVDEWIDLSTDHRAEPGETLVLSVGQVSSAPFEISLVDPLGASIERFELTGSSVLDDTLDPAGRTWRALQHRADGGFLRVDGRFLAGRPLLLEARPVDEAQRGRVARATVAPAAGRLVSVRLVLEERPPQQAPPRRTIDGWIVDADSGEAIVGARVVAFLADPPGDGGDRRPETHSRADGSFALPLTGGSARGTLRAEHPDYERSEAACLEAGEAVRIEMRPKGGLTVTVYDRAGQILPGAALLMHASTPAALRGLTDKLPPATPQRAETDALGRAQFTSLATGRHQVFLLPRPDAPEQEALSSASVYVEVGERSTLELFADPPTGVVLTGRVSGFEPEVGRFLPWLIAVSNDGRWHPGRPDGAGYRIEGLQPGDYLAILVCEGEGGTTARLHSQVSLTEEALQQLDFAAPTGTVVGRMRDEAVDWSGFEVTARPVLPAGLANDLARVLDGAKPRASLAADGSFELGGCPEGELRLSIRQPGGAEAATTTATLSGDRLELGRPLATRR
ncbi:MAG: RNA polymerase sigma factor [Planctomycetota bacterium]